MNSQDNVFHKQKFAGQTYIGRQLAERDLQSAVSKGWFPLAKALESESQSKA